MAMIGIVILISTLTALSRPVESLVPQVKYVHPSNSSVSCNVSEPCTFDQYANDQEQQFSNMTFIFLPGDHQLNTSINLNGVQNVSFQGMSTEGSVTITLAPQVDLTFSSCYGIEITSLNFLLSGDYEYRLILYNTNNVFIQSVLISTEDENSTGNSAILSQASSITISDSNFVGIIGQCGATLQALDSSEITFTGTNNFANNSGKLGGAIHAKSSMLHFDGMSITLFIGNTAASNMIMPGYDIARTLYTKFNDIIPFESGIGGAVYVDHSQFIVSGCAQFLTNNATNLGGAVAAVNHSTVVINGSLCSKVNNSSIVFDSNGVITEDELPFNVIGSGGAIYIHHSKANISNISLFNNYSPMHGGAAYFVRSTVSLMNIVAISNMANKWFGGALRFFQCTHVYINGENSFANNYARLFGGAIEFCSVQLLNITGVNYFEGNKAKYGGAFDVYFTPAASIGGNITFKHNYGIKPTDNGRSSGGAVYVYDSTLEFTGHMEYENNTAGDGGAISCNSSSEIHFYANNIALFRDNQAEYFGGAIHIEDSRIIYHAHSEMGNVFQFESNTAKYGGAISMHGKVKLTLIPNVTIVFVENRAQIHGGAIFVDIFTTSECMAGTMYVPECFIRLDICYSSFDNDQFLLNFTNNKAGERGHVLYGGWLNECGWLFKSSAECSTSMNEEPAIEIVKNNISTRIPHDDEVYTFSSKPNSLCIYNESSTGQIECGLPAAIHVSPGEIFTVSLVTIDQYSNAIDGVKVMSDQTNTDDYQIIYNHSNMTNSESPLILFYQVFVTNESLVQNENKLNFSLYTDPEGNCRNSTHFDITVKPCPPGFQFSADIQKCGCANLFQKSTDCGDCIIEDITIGRPSNIYWMNLTTDYILLYDGGCPLDYCKYAKVYVPQNDPDVQCNDGRTGKLCGNCIENYSLVLGSLSCKHNCSHTYLLLILPIAALGILLIVLLFALHLTVAAGTINGLLFYVNIVQANHQIFLPTVTANPLKHFYSIFLGWLNLDFGIETCFYDGMDIIVYSWLQFLFPVYLWILMFIIILSARYSQRVAHNLGQNPVAVLATVLLISYGKMLKSIIVPLSRAKLQTIAQENSNTSNNTEFVWLYNGNMSFSDTSHILLVVFAILVLLFLFLPYSFLLLCGHWLQAKSHWRLLSWINKFKPFMDAYHAPYKKNSRHWIGVFLLARCSLFLTFAFDPTGLDDQHLNLLIITSVIAILSIIKGRVYEKWYNDFLESSFLLNLCLLSVATIYVQSEKPSTDKPQDIIDNQVIVSSLSVGIAFIFFIGIMAFHTCQQIKELDLFGFFQSVHRRCRLCLKKKSIKMVDKEQSTEIISKSSVRLRELLLDDDTQV